jgi:hypothetical protein
LLLEVAAKNRATAKQLAETYTDISLTNKNIERVRVINPIDFVRETEDLLMRTDSALRYEAMDALVRTLGTVDAERFISIVNAIRLTTPSGAVDYGTT